MKAGAVIRSGSQFRNQRRLSPLAGWLRYRLWGLRNRLQTGRHALPESLCARPEHPPGLIRCRPALFQPEHLSRITGCGFQRPLALELRTLSATEFTETPLQISEPGAAIVIGGIFVTMSELLWLGPGKVEMRRLLSTAPEQPRMVIPNSGVGMNYFGHWLGDDCSAMEAYADDPDLLSLVRQPWQDGPTYEALFGHHWPETAVMRSPDTTLLRDIGFGRAKAERYRRLRARLRSGLKPDGAGRIVYIRRGPSAKQRDITNHAELEERLIRAGVDVVTPEGDTRAFLSRIVDADLIISVEGSQACHAIYALRDQAALLVLQPPDRFYAAPHEWMRLIDMHCGMVIGTASPGGFHICPDEVIAMADRLLTASERSRPH